MDATYPTNAIILNRRDYREADRLVSVYTPEFGRLSLLARGARKWGSKLAPHLEPISISKILVVKGKGFDYVGSAIMSEAFLNIKQDLNKLYFVGQALSIFSRLVHEGETDKELYQWLERWLHNIDEASPNLPFDKEDGRFRLALFSWRLLSLLGYGTQLQTCIVCDEKIKAGKNSFDLSRGGLLCSSCQTKPDFNILDNSLLALSDNCIKLLRLIDGGEIKNIKFSPKLLKEWENLNIQRLRWLQA
ncbi:DNA repair protein RecO [Patescibacteria group bacterium]|nr:DNA repair protein RecO [Patescibacteria group bacterium]